MILEGSTKSPIATQTECYGAPSISDEPDIDGLRSLASLYHIDSYPLAFRQIDQAPAIKRRGMHEDVFAAAVPDDEPEPLIGVVLLHCTDLLGGGLIGGLVRPFGSWAPSL